MKTSLIITTYNWEHALNLVLESVLSQSVLPSEIIIADDGSGIATADLIKKWKSKISVPIIHSWQKDSGFRLALSRNKAFALATGDYLILIDGDMILHRKFIEDHIKFSEVGFFMQGCRVKLSSESAKSHVTISKLGVMSSLIFDNKNRVNAIRLPCLTPLLFGKKDSLSNIKACNMSFWKKDVFEVNGFSNDFVGWGGEDVDFTKRMLKSGINKKKLKLCAIAFHIFHNESSRDNKAINRKLADSSSSDYACSNGLHQSSKFE